MRFARFDLEGKILEIFEIDTTENLKKTFHADIVKTLKRVDEKAEVNDFWIDGKNLGKRPNRESVIKDGQFVEDESLVAERQFREAGAAALKRLQDLSSIKDKATKSAIEDILAVLHLKQTVGKS